MRRGSQFFLEWKYDSWKGRSFLGEDEFTAKWPHLSAKKLVHLHFADALKSMKNHYQNSHSKLYE